MRLWGLVREWYSRTANSNSDRVSYSFSDTVAISEVFLAGVLRTKLSQCGDGNPPSLRAIVPGIFAQVCCYARGSGCHSVFESQLNETPLRKEIHHLHIEPVSELWRRFAQRDGKNRAECQLCPISQCLLSQRQQLKVVARVEGSQGDYCFCKCLSCLEISRLASIGKGDKYRHPRRARLHNTDVFIVHSKSPCRSKCRVAR